MNVSVIIPAYNEEKVIGRCLRAIKAQTLKPKEIIVSDGGSTDKTVKIARKLCEKVVVAKKRGISHGRNLGAKAATGDILCFIDADSYPTKNWLENIVRSFEPGVVMVAGPGRPITKSAPIKFAYFLTFWFLAPMLFKLGQPMMAGWNLSCTRKAFQKIRGFDEHVATAEDLDLATRLSSHGRAVYNTKAVVYTSTRREEAYGVAHLFLFHLKNGLNFAFFRKSADFYPDVR